MASKRQHDSVDYAEESYTDDEEEVEEELEIDKKLDDMSKFSRSRKFSITTNSCTEATKTVGETQARRRGRGPSKRPCLNRNALMARENRQKKKEYIEKIEKKLQFYQQDTQELKNTIQKQSMEIKRLNNEVTYLKSVLNNNTVITSLLKSMNESLQKMHSSNNNAAASYNELPKSSADVMNWVVSGQMNTSKMQDIPLSLAGTTNESNSEITKEDYKKINVEQKNANVARKTMRFNNSVLPKLENQPNFDRTEIFDKQLTEKSLPSYDSCEYKDKNSVGLENELPRTPMSIISNSFDNDEGSLSDTDFSQLSSFKVDLFDTINKLNDDSSALQFERDSLDLFNDLFHTSEKDKQSNNDIIDINDISKTSNSLSNKTLFDSLENIGVCLHINSYKISLEYCSICYLNNINSKIV